MELAAALFVIFLLYLASTILSTTAVVVLVLSIAGLLVLVDPGRLLWRR